MALDSKYKSKIKMSTTDGAQSTDIKEVYKQWNGAGHSYLNKDLKIYKFATDVPQRIRLLPNMDENNKCDYFAFPYAIHYFKTPGNPSAPCPLQKHGNCPSCEYNKYLAFEMKDTNAAKPFRPAIYYFAYILDQNKIADGPQIWAFTANVNELIKSQMQDPTTGKLLTVEDPEMGYDLHFTRVKTGKSIEGQSKELEQILSVQFAREATPLTNNVDLTSQLLDYVIDHPILGSFNFVTPDEIKELAGLNPQAKAQAEQNFAANAAAVMRVTATPVTSLPPTQQTPQPEAPKPQATVEQVMAKPTAVAQAQQASVASSVPTTPPKAPEADASLPPGGTKEQRMEEIRAEMAQRRAAKEAASKK